MRIFQGYIQNLHALKVWQPEDHAGGYDIVTNYTNGLTEAGALKMFEAGKPLGTAVKLYGALRKDFVAKVMQDMLPVGSWSKEWGARFPEGTRMNRWELLVRCIADDPYGKPDWIYEKVKVLYDSLAGLKGVFDRVDALLGLQGESVSDRATLDLSDLGAFREAATAVEEVGAANEQLGIPGGGDVIPSIRDTDPAELGGRNGEQDVGFAEGGNQLGKFENDQGQAIGTLEANGAIPNIQDVQGGGPGLGPVQPAASNPPGSDVQDMLFNGEHAVFENEVPGR